MVAEQRPKLIPARDFLKALAAAGIIHDGDHVRRVIIDAEMGSVVVVHVERLGDERLLHIARNLTPSSEVTIADPNA